MHPSPQILKAALCVCLPCLASSARAETPETPSPSLQAPGTQDPDGFKQLPHLLLKDTQEVFRAPSRWDSSDWTYVCLGAVGVVGVAATLDGPLDRGVTRNAKPSWDHLAKTIAPLGGAGSVLIVGGAYLGGVAFKNPELRAVGVDAGMTMAIAELTMTLPLKYVVGRSRPSEGEGSKHFNPFHGGKSFPSSHTTQAFALASVISAHADTPWVSGVSYGLATLVGLSRIEQHDHFLSDVLVGGAIGTFVGHTVVHYNQSGRAQASSRLRVSFEPLLGSDYRGAQVRMVF